MLIRFEAVEAARRRRRTCLLGRICTKIWVIYWNWLERSEWREPSISWSEASDANDTAKIRPFKNTKNSLLRVMTVLRLLRPCLFLRPKTTQKVTNFGSFKAVFRINYVSWKDNFPGEKCCPWKKLYLKVEKNIPWESSFPLFYPSKARDKWSHAFIFPAQG
jgi:hypothetical protein